MSSRDRDTKTFQDKFKVFFKKSASALPAARNELLVTAELERELGADSPQPRRLRAIRDLGDRLLHLRVHEGGVEKLWSCTRDLLEDANSEARHTALWFLSCIAEGQADYLQIMRTIFFRYLKETHPSHQPEDYQLRFKLVQTLTNNGKNISCFEEEIGQFLLEWLPQVTNSAHLVEFLQLVINVVKFNATYLDEHIVHGIVNCACEVCVWRAEAACVGAGLSLLEAVLSYSLLPCSALRRTVAALCRTVNLDQHYDTSCKLMRGVMGADIGHAALQELARLLQAEAGGGGAGSADAGLVRGAVFYINTSLWGPRRVPSLRVSFLAVLPAFLKALESNHPVVTYEVIVSLQSVVDRAQAELFEPAWDVLLRILAAIIQQDRTFEPPNEPIHTKLHALITSIEQLHEAKQYYGDVDALFDLIDSCGHERPEASTMRVVRYRAEALSPTGSEWVAAALALADRYLRCEPRLAVRLHTLQALLDFVKRHRHAYGDELVELVAVPVLGACALDAECALRAAAARALAELARNCAADACTDLVDLLEKILNRPFDMFVSDVPVPRDADASDAALAARGLVAAWHARLASPPAGHAARCFLVLLQHLDLHYRRPALFLHHPDVRARILDMLFSLRANRFECVGACYDAAGQPVYGAAALRLRPRCSPWLLAGAAREPPPGACTLPVGRAARLLTTALGREADWPVLLKILRALPHLLTSRALVVGRRPQDLDLLASTLCSMLADHGLRFPEGVKQKPLQSEFHGAVLPALAALPPYHAYLEPHTQQRIVRCLLKYGMVLRAPQPYIAALTVFTLETRETMVKMLPEVLLDLSKISDTKPIAGPMLEFLSTLTRLPKVFASFVEDQYMSVFAILLPYTNPSRYNHYVVSLAHHVIAAWFLKCRLSYRRNFVRFIIHGLHNYIIMPFEEQLYRSGAGAAAGGPERPVAGNEDSSNRQRSSSLGSRAVSRAPIGGRASGPATAASSSAAFHVELTETCLDLLARYTSTPCSVKPRRSDTAEFLFTGGQSMTWLVGHKLVTITTSGCLQNSIKQGLCDRCAALCRQHAESAKAAAAPPPVDPVRPADGEDEPGAAQAQAQAHVPDIKRQNSSEGKADPLAEALHKLAQRFERTAREVEGEEGAAGWARAAELAAAGACPCWCAGWAEVHVRSPTGDVAWLMRVQNQMSWDHQLDSPLRDVAALLCPAAAAPSPSPSPSSASAAPAAAPPPPGPGPPPPPLPPRDLHKSSSDSVVGAAGARGSRVGTLPINIPGSPQRQSSAGAADEDDLLLLVPEGKSRHPVRRSNSSPEMSSSWKAPRAAAEAPRAPRDPPRPPPFDPDDMILLPGCEPTANPSPSPNPSAVALHASKKAKKSDMRVSCEAIPEEMCAGTSPHPPPLATHYSDPGCPPAAAAAQPQPQPLPQPHAPAPGPGPAPPLHHQLQKTASDGSVSAAGSKPPAAPRDRDDLPPLARSKRSNTISVMSPTRRHRPAPSQASGAAGAGAAAGGSVGGAGGGVTPSFVFLQLYHNMSTFPLSPPVPGERPAAQGALEQRPLRVAGVQHERTIKNIDLIPPVETYKIGVLYVGPGQQDDEVAIMRNEYGSVRYAEFLTQLGSLVPLDGAQADDQPHLFLNLEKGGKDGRYTYVWHTDVMQVLFHVATAMPSSPRDPSCNEKRKYIGNDYVSIVYNDSGEDFHIQTIKGQFNLCIVVVEPFEHGMNRVFVKTKDERIRSKFLAHLDAHCVSDCNAALLARQMALHCSLASQISLSLQSPAGSPYASNSLERLRLIKKLRARCAAERADRGPASEAYAGPRAPDLARRVAIDDFNEYS